MSLLSELAPWLGFEALVNVYQLVVEVLDGGLILQWVVRRSVQSANIAFQRLSQFIQENG
jgi:hypothetical protein